MLYESRSRLSIIALLTLLAASCGDSGGDSPLVQLSYEAMPGSGVALATGEVDTSMAAYDDKQTFTSEVFGELVPEVFAAVGVDFAALDSDTAPGGFLLETNPAMQSRGALTAGDADRVSAALGYVMFQWSVLITDFDAEDGDTGYGVVEFSDDALTPTLAQDFFAHAGGVDEGLGGGYSAFEDTMIFINLRGGDGMPYSGLDDDTFLTRLEQAVDGFTDADVTLVESGAIDAYLIENDWSTATDGSEYLATIAVTSAAEQAELDRLQTAYNQKLLQAAATHGWEPQSARPARTPVVQRTSWWLGRTRPSAAMMTR